MDFFAAQELARKRTRVMVVLFVLAVLCIALALYAVCVYALGSNLLAPEDAVPGPLVLWQPNLFFGILAGVVILVTACSLFKIARLRSGGAYVARSMGGLEVLRSTKDADEQMLLNIVEEMSIASGVPMPAVYLLPEEGINAFAAGFTVSDAVVAVTRGCLRSLTRDELQGVVAHEFSHILNGDMRMNIRLMGVLFGILAIAVLGQLFVRGTAHASFWRSRRSKGSGSATLVLLLVGLAVMVIGYIGVFFGRLIQSSISRQREYLADAAAVQFTRHPQGIAGALKKIGAAPMHGVVANAHSQEAAHFFFASAFKSRRMRLFATHPPLSERIRAIEPSWDGRFNHAARTHAPRRADQQKSKSSRPPLQPHDFIHTIGQVSAAAIVTAQQMREQIGADLDHARQNMQVARGVLIGLGISASSADDDAVQLLQVKKSMEATVYREVESWLPRLRGMHINQRFALLDAALPIAVGPDPATCTPLIDLLHDLAHQDAEVNLEELALLRATSMFVEQRRRPARRIAAMSPAQMEMPLCVMLSAIAYATGSDEAVRVTAFKKGARICNRYLLKESLLLPQDCITIEALEAALDQFTHLPIPQKKVIFEGALAVVLADGSVSQDEYSVIRVIALSLGLPMPPLSTDSSAETA